MSLRTPVGRTGRALFVVAGVLVSLCRVPASRADDRVAPQKGPGIEGTVYVVVEDDFEHQTWRRQHILEEHGTGQVLRLRAVGRELAFETGDRVRIRGQRIDDELIVEPGDAAAIDFSATPAETPPGLLGTVDARSTLLLIVDFADQAVECSTSTVRNVMYQGAQSVNGLYFEASFGAVAFPPDLGLVRRVSIPADTWTCSPHFWAGLADEEAVQQGIPVHSYRHRIYVLPTTVGCPWAGRGHLGCGLSCRSWIRFCGEGDLYAHELGHNLNLAHASRDSNNDGGLDCEYCDVSDVMGYSVFGWRQFNAPHKYQLGWLTSDQVVQLDPGLGGETISLSALDIDPVTAPFPQIVRIAHAGFGGDYYLAYRRRSGYDQTLSSNYAWQTNIHRWRGGHANTLFVEAIGDGDEFSDTGQGISVRQLAHDGSSATVSIELTCARAPLAINVTPAIQTGQLGQPLTYDIAVTSEDLGDCLPAELDLQPATPPGWSRNLETTALALNPGETGYASLSVQSSLSSQRGGYGVGVRVTDAATPLHDDVVTAIYQVETPSPDQVVDIQSRVRQRRFVVLSWMEPPSPSPVVFYRIYRNNLLVGGTPRKRFVDRTSVRGEIYKYYITAINLEGFESRPSPRVIVDLTGPDDPDEPGPP